MTDPEQLDKAISDPRTRLAVGAVKALGGTAMSIVVVVGMLFSSGAEKAAEAAQEAATAASAQALSNGQAITALGQRVGRLEDRQQNGTQEVARLEARIEALRERVRGLESDLSYAKMSADWRGLAERETQRSRRRK